MPKINLILVGDIDDKIKNSFPIAKPLRFDVPDLSVTAITIKAKKGWRLSLNCKNSNGDVAPLSTSYLQGYNLLGTSLKIYDNLKDKAEFNALMQDQINQKQKVLFGEIVLLDTEALMNKSAISERFNAKLKKREQEMQDEIKDNQKRDEEKLERERRINNIDKRRLRQQIAKYEEDLLVLPTLLKEEVTRVFTNSIFTNIENDPTTSKELRGKLNQFREKTDNLLKNRQRTLEEEFEKERELELSEKEKEIEEKEIELKRKEIELKSKEESLSNNQN